MRPGEDELNELLRQISELPKGNITYKVIRSRNVIYRGESTEDNGIRYLNVEDYLEGKDRLQIE